MLGWIESHPLGTDEDVEPFVSAARVLTLQETEVIAAGYRYYRNS